MEDMKLREIAELYLQGYSQSQIGERLGIKQQTVSYRLTVIKSNYSELLQKNDDFYQNTKSTNFVPTGEIGDLVKKKEEEETAPVSTPQFIF